VTVHFEQSGKPMCLLLNIVEVVTSHSGVNLAAAFTKILDDFGIAHKVSLLDYLHKNLRLTIDVMCQILGVTVIYHSMRHTAPRDKWVS